MARPVEFDYDLVLEKAMEQFNKEGYEASSVQKLLDAAQINRGTLYNSFGDKDTFFMLSLDRYNVEMKGLIKATLGADQKAANAIASFFDAANGLPPKKRAMGCLIVNSLCESIIWNKEMQSKIRDSLNQIRKALLGRTKELEKQRGLAKGLSADLAADLLINLYVAIKVGARNGKPHKALSEQVAFTLKVVLH
jgi:TetR/AcrR family transcriptional repressor of nem operon